MSHIRQYINLVESMMNDPLGIVARIREMDSALIKNYHEGANIKKSFGVTDDSHFSIFSCGRCRAPVWQQPCPVCDFYPMGNMDDGVRMFTPEWEEIAKKYRAGSHTNFIRLVDRAGNYAAWYFQRYGKTTAFSPKGFGQNKPSDMFIHFIQPYVDEALSESWPTAEEIWASYKKDSD